MKNESTKQTRPLSNYDHNVLLPVLIKALETKKGKKNAVSGKQILQGLQSQNLKINERDVTMLINHIRTNDLVVGLIATSVGYYIANSEHELVKYENTLLVREKTIRKVRKSIIRQRRAMLLQRPTSQTQLF